MPLAHAARADRPSRAPGTVTAARRAAVEILAALRRGDLLDGAFDRHAAPLDPRDRRWVQELVYGTLRRRAALDALLDPRVRGGLARLDDDLTDLLRLGLYQLRAMGSVPPYAAISQGVDLARHRHGIGAARLVNAVLRRLDRERPEDPRGEDLEPVARLALQGSHPEWLVARWVARWGLDGAAALLDANNQEAPLIARPWGCTADALRDALEGEGVQVTPAPLVAGSLRLAGGPPLAELVAFREGHCFVQDPAATLVTRYADLPPGSTVLDLCAAPGGKAVELARDARLVVAADRAPARLERVRQNVARLGVRTIALAVADATHPPFAPADAVVIDAPCTGTGTFRRHPDARWRLRISDLAVTGAAQRAILAAAAPLVRPGGLLVYSTCSLEPEENDAQVTRFLAAHPDFTLEPPADAALPAGVVDAGLLRVLPQRHGTDGSFAARLRRGEA